MNNGDNYVLSIYGTKLDPQTPFAKLQKRKRTSCNIKNEEIEKQIKKIIENKVFPDGFYVYIHKTKTSCIPGILAKGLEIREKNGGLDSTMSRIFDSKSEDIAGDWNYLFNSIAEGNQYGSNSVIAVFPRCEGVIYRDIIETRGSYSVIPTQYIMASVKASGETEINDEYKNALEKGLLVTDGKINFAENIGEKTVSDTKRKAISTSDIGKKTVPKASIEDKKKVSNLFSRFFGKNKEFK